MMISVTAITLLYAIGTPVADSQMNLDAFLDLNVVVTVDCVEDDPFEDDERTYRGSGFVLDSVSDTIYVMTARHVLGLEDIAHADVNSPEVKSYRITVRFPSGASREADAFLLNRYHDIALLRVPNAAILNEDEDFFPVHIDTTLHLDVGDRVYAIGHPYAQMYPSCTQGIITAFPPSLQYSSDSTIASPIIQHDASVNPGSSGGPLVLVEDGSYSLIGMNIGEPDRSVMGGVGDMGFALNLCEILPVPRSVEAEYIFVYCRDPQAVDEAIDDLEDVGYEGMEPTFVGAFVTITVCSYVWVLILQKAADWLSLL